VQTLGTIVTAGTAAILVAALRQPLEHVVCALFGLPARLLAAGGDEVTSARAHAQDSGARSRATLAYGSSEEAAESAWDVVAPLLYLLLLVVILCGDLVLSSLRFGSLLGIPIDGLPIEGSVLDLLAGLLFLAVIATYGCVLLDVSRVTPLRRPYGLVDGRARAAIAGTAVAGTALSVLAAALFFLWGQYAIFGEPSPDIASLFVTVFAVLLVGASIFTAGGALGCVTAMWVLLCALAATLLAVTAALLHLLVVALEGAHTIATAVVRLLARPGTVLWNWLTTLAPMSSLQLSPLPEPTSESCLVAQPQDRLELAAGP
jgi:hypothetical protein